MSQFYIQNYDSFVNYLVLVCVREKQQKELWSCCFLKRVNLNNIWETVFQALYKWILNLHCCYCHQLYFKDEKMGPGVAWVCSELEFDYRLMWLQCPHCFLSNHMPQTELLATCSCHWSWCHFGAASGSEVPLWSYGCPWWNLAMALCSPARPLLGGKKLLLRGREWRAQYSPYCPEILLSFLNENSQNSHY